MTKTREDKIMVESVFFLLFFLSKLSFLDVC